MSKKIISTFRSGFRMTFENGLTASVQWGDGTYTDNHDGFDLAHRHDARSDNAEVSVTYGDDFIDANHFVNEEKQNHNDSVVGYLSPEEVVDFLERVKRSSKEDIETFLSEE